jgi:hypothetical protein
MLAALLSGFAAPNPDSFQAWEIRVSVISRILRERSPRFAASI